MKYTSIRNRTVQLLMTSMIALIGANEADAQIPLFTYGFADVSQGLSGTTAAGGTASGVTFGSFTAVGTPANPNAGQRFSFTSWSLGAADGSDVFTGGIDLSEYYEVTVTPTGGTTLDLDAISFVLQRSSTGIRQYSVRSSLDSFAANLAASITSADLDLSVVSTPQLNIFQVADTSTNANSGSRITLTAEYNAIKDPLTFRFYGWNAEALGGTFSIDDVAFIGQTTAVPEPGAASLVLGGLACMAARRRRFAHQA